MGRFEWRPSRLLIASLVALGALAAFSCLQSDLSPGIAWPMAVAALGYGGWIARQEWCRSGFELVVSSDGAIRIDGNRVEAFQLAWRGSLGFMSWRVPGGRLRHRLWLPDTLPSPLRRELRLALMRVEPARETRSVAP